MLEVLEILKIVMLIFIPILVLVAVYKINWNVVTKSANDKLRTQVLSLLDSGDENIIESNNYFDLERIDK